MPDDADVVHRDLVVRVAIGVGDEVAQVTGMPLIGIGQGVGMPLRVVVSPGALAVWRAAIAELVDVDGVCAVGA